MIIDPESGNGHMAVSRMEVLEQIVDPGAELGYDRYWCAGAESDSAV